MDLRAFLASLILFDAVQDEAPKANGSGVPKKTAAVAKAKPKVKKKGVAA